MNKVITGVIITILAVGIITGIIAVNHNNNKDANKSTTQTTNSATAETTTPTTSNSASSEATSTDKVTIVNYSFSPAKTTVKKGTTVTWTNQAGSEHTVTIDSGVGPKSDPIVGGGAFTYTFNEVGTFAYHCSIHTSMHGTVEVTE